MTTVTDHLVHHDVDDTRHLIALAATLDNLIWTKEVWVAAIAGRDMPARGGDDIAALTDRHDIIAAEWLDLIRDIDRRDAWDDSIVDALCDPPERFVLASIVAHVVTFSAHRRLLVRHALRAGGVEVDQGDPIVWLHAREGETP